MPLAVLAALSATVSEWAAYPDPQSRELRTALSAYTQVPYEQLVCGNGAADLIFRLCQVVAVRCPAGEVLVVAPTFSEYEAAALQAGLSVRRFELAKPALELDTGIIAAVRAETRLVFVCNPNNPTGLLSERALLEQLAARCEQVGALLVVDECFLSFTATPHDHSMIPMLQQYPCLAVLDAFTKKYALAGLRLGYLLCATAELAAAVAATGQPWAVSTPAQVAGIAALRSTDYLTELRALIAAERPRLVAGLAALGFAVLPGTANYLCFRAPNNTPDLAAALRTHGILIRSCANYPALSAAYYRVAIRTPADNDTLITALSSVLQN
jgi:threonine-phosphate decarboxylase